MTSKFRTLAVLVATLALGACGDSPSGNDGQEISRAQLSGNYRFSKEFGATEFKTTEGGTTTNQLDRGASLSISLAADGTTTGRLVVPGGDEDGGDLNADMAGTWTLDDGIVNFDQDADTFVRDLPFEVRGTRLVGDRTFGDVRVQMTLAKQ